MAKQKRQRRTTEQMIADLEAERAALLERAVRKKAAADPARKHAAAADKDRLVRSTSGSAKLVHPEALGKVPASSRKSSVSAVGRIARDRLEKSRRWFGQAGPPFLRRAPGLREQDMPSRGIRIPHQDTQEAFLAGLR